MTTSKEEVPIYETFRLKSDRTTPPTKAGGGEEPPKGRLYSAKYAAKPGGLRVEEMIFGVQMAHLSCTDDAEGRMEGSSPNTMKALQEVLSANQQNYEPGDEREPLSKLLEKHFQLKLDCWINESGVRKGRAVDTQGFIASNEDTIVLSYRFSTSLLDWITNLSMTSSEWEPDVDEVIGHAGYCSCFDGLFTKYFTSRGKPRVHTGFYNNFLYTAPMIRKHIFAKLMDKNTTPKKVYICGCSLGAAIATLAFCFVLLELPWEDPDFNHKLINVTAGSPRSCDTQMQQLVMDKMSKLRPLDRAVICRLVYNQDLVPHVPFQIFSPFVHLEKLVYITAEGQVMVNPNLKTSRNFAEIKSVFSSFFAEKKGQPKAEANEEETMTDFEKEVASTPGPIKDHMPYWYLTFLQKLQLSMAEAPEQSTAPISNLVDAEV